MTQRPGRQVLVANDTPVIQNALYMLLEGVGSARETREKLQAIAAQRSDGLILDLQVVETPLPDASPRVKDVRLDHLANVAVVTCEVANHQVLHQVEEFCRPHFFSNHLLLSLGVFVHALLALF